MSSIEQKVEQFAQQIIEHHGFRFNEGFSCLIPDREPFPSNEGLFLWGFSQKRMRFETKVEKFHTSTRMKRMEQMLDLPEKEYKKLFASVETYLKSLKEIGFEEIGKGVNLFGKAKVSNVQADAKLFENNVEALKKFEDITLNNPIVKFAEEHGYFEVKEKNTLVWDSIFGRESASASPAKSSAKTSAKAPAKAAPTKATPAKAAPTKAIPAKAALTKATPTKAIPTKAAPTKAAPTKAAPTKAAPTKVAPTKAAPTKATPAKAAPTKATSTKATPTKATPTKATSTKGTSTKATPTKAKATSTKATPAKTTPAKVAPAKAAPAKTAPAAKNAPMKAAPVKSAPVAKIAPAKAPAKVAPAKAPAKAKASAKTTQQSHLVATIPLKEKFQKLAASQPASSLNWEENKNVWGKQVDALYKKIQNWLSEHHKSGYLKFSTIKVTLSEPGLGDYDINSLELNLVGSHQVIFDPIETNILGAVGRMDLSHRGHSNHKTMLLLFKKGNNNFQWESWKGLNKEEQQPFTKETFEALLNQWIES